MSTPQPSPEPSDNVEQAPRQIFRQASLERLSNPQQMDNLLVVVSPKAWVALLCLIVLIFLALLWTLFGSIPIKVDGNGIVMNQQGELLNIQTKMGGTIRMIYVKPSSEIKQGDPIAEIFDAEEELKLARARIKAQNLQQNLEKLQHEISIETKTQRDANERELEAKKFSIEQEEKTIHALETDIVKKKALLDDGLISYTTLADAEARLANERIQLELIKSAIKTIEYNLSKGYRTEELKAKEQEVFRANEERDLLETRQPYYKVYSPSNGVVLELLASQGDVVHAGTPLIWMEEHDPKKKSTLLIYGYFPVEKGKRLSPGKQVQIEVSTVDSQEYGYLLGTVAEVSTYAVSRDSIAKMIHNKEIVEYLTSGAKAVIQVLIKPKMDPSSNSFVWTSGKTPPITLSTGTVCKLQAIIHRIRPIYYVLPVEALKYADAIVEHE